MRYLSHEKNLVHRDIAARNCLMTENETVKISDFGLTIDRERETSSKEADKSLHMPIRNMAVSEYITCITNNINLNTNTIITARVTSQGTKVLNQNRCLLVWYNEVGNLDWRTTTMGSCGNKQRNCKENQERRHTRCTINGTNGS